MNPSTIRTAAVCGMSGVAIRGEGVEDWEVDPNSSAASWIGLAQAGQVPFAHLVLHCGGFLL